MAEIKEVAWGRFICPIRIRNPNRPPLRQSRIFQIPATKTELALTLFWWVPSLRSA